MHIAAYTDAVAMGGAERSLGHLLAALDPEIEVTVLGIDRAVLDHLLAERPAAAARLLPAIGSKRNLRAIGAQARAIAATRADVLHVNRQSPWAGRYALLTALTAGMPVVAVDHLPMEVHAGWQRALTRWASARMLAHVAVGDGAARLIERYAGLPTGSVRAIHNGVPDRPLEPMARPARGPVVGSLGRLDAQKGYDLLVDALPELPDVTLVLVGDGPERRALERRAEELGVRERLVLPGWSGDARRHLTTFDVFALPSRYEGFPLAMIEAMLAGVPIVATDVGSVTEAIEHCATGRIVPPEDPRALAGALSELLADPEARRQLGERARERARRRYTAEAMARAYERIYAEAER